MGDPVRTKDPKEALQAALNEVVSAMSALNMEPEPLTTPTGVYLSERDVWAAHAMEHLRAVVANLMVLEATGGVAAFKWKAILACIDVVEKGGTADMCRKAVAAL